MCLPKEDKEIGKGQLIRKLIPKKKKINPLSSGLEKDKWTTNNEEKKKGEAF